MRMPLERQEGHFLTNGDTRNALVSVVANEIRCASCKSRRDTGNKFAGDYVGEQFFQIPGNFRAISSLPSVIRLLLKCCQTVERRRTSDQKSRGYSAASRSGARMIFVGFALNPPCPELDLHQSLVARDMISSAGVIVAVNAALPVPAALTAATANW